MSNGYLWFVPDIAYTIGYPGESAEKCIISGVQSLIARGFRFRPALRRGQRPGALCGRLTTQLASGELEARVIAEAVRRYFESNEKEKFKSRIGQERKRYSWDRMVGTIEKIGKQFKDQRCR